MRKNPQSEPGRGARALALDILAAASRPQGKSVEELLAATLKGRPQLPRPERALLLELVQGVKRWELRLDYFLSQLSAIPLAKLHPLVLLILRLAAYQILMLDRVPARAAVHQAGLEAKARRLPAAYGGFINAVLRRLAAGDLPPLPERQTDLAAALSVEYSHPAWLVRRWLERWGLEQTEARLSANNRLPPLTVRVNTLKTDPASLIARLNREGVAAQACRFSPVGLHLSGLKAPPLELPSYQEGLWLFQDEAAQLVSLLLPPAAGRRLELGAGRGGKSTHLAELSGNAGLILALELHQGRLRELRGALQRWGASAVQPVRADAAGGLPIGDGVKMDAALLDAPCSALGILRRHPEIKTRLTEADLATFPPRQRAWLEAAAAVLRTGGHLLYITCTVEPAENQELIESFLGAHPEFRLATDPQRLPAAARHLVQPPGWFSSSGADDLDGFFAALLSKDH
ncbi:MAG: 16S rRNA (cytosine(967)-C(5))-methyltransferase RsmB [Desulfobaccales bacterium]